MNLTVMVTSPGSVEWLPLADVLTSHILTDVKQMVTLAKSMTRLLKHLHADELVMADLNVSSVNIRNWEQVGKYLNKTGKI